MQIVCLDLEGVLVSEFWIALAERTGIGQFSRTTRDEPDYDRLMRYRLGLLRQHGLEHRQGRALQLVGGPEGIETGWWDDASVARNYFIAGAEDGCLVWVYRSRVPAAPGVLGRLSEPTWHLHGLFACGRVTGCLLRRLYCRLYCRP